MLCILNHFIEVEIFIFCKIQFQLRLEGDFYSPEKPTFTPAERPQQVRPEDNLRQEGTFYTPEKPKFQPVERPKSVKPQDNLRPSEGDFQRPEKPKFVPAEKPKQVKPKDNLKPEGVFYQPEKSGPVGKIIVYLKMFCPINSLKKIVLLINL